MGWLAGLAKGGEGKGLVLSVCDAWGLGAGNGCGGDRGQWGCGFFGFESED